MHNEPNGEATEKIKQLIANRYRLLRPLGKGAVGQVFLTEDTIFDPPKLVALKLLHSQYLHEPSVREDLKREASTLARFNHPNILRVSDFAVTADLAYIVTDFAEGGSLADKIRPDPTQPPVRMPLSEVARYLEQMADALDEAHAQGLVHRDIKPHNILLDRRGRPLLADFGLVTALSNSQSSVLVETSTSGTPPYMAPEQWLGQVGKTSDIYALAVVVYQLITGLTPFQGGNLELMGQHLNAPPPPLAYRAPDLVYPTALDAVLAGALAKDARQRTRPAAEFYRRFKAALVTTPALTASNPISLPLIPTERTNTNVSVTSPSSSPQIASVNPASLSENTLNLYPKRQPLPLVGLLVAALLLLTIGAGLAFTIGPLRQGETTPVANVTLTPTSIPSTPGTTTLAVQTLAVNATTSLPVTTVAVTTAPAVTIAPTTTTPAVTTLAPTTTTPAVLSVSAKELFVFNGHTERVYSVAFAPDSKTLASASDDDAIRLWSVQPGNYRQASILYGHTVGVSGVAFGPDGRTFASVGSDKLVKLWDVATGKELNTLRGHTERVYSVAFSPNGSLLATGSDDKSIRLWSVAGGASLDVLQGHTSKVRSVAFSPDSKFLASSANDYTARLWTLEQNRATQSRVLAGHSDSVWSVAFSPDGKTLATSSSDRTMKLWEVATGKELTTLTGHTGWVISVAFSPDGKILASGSQDSTVRLWEVATGKELNSLRGHQGEIYSVAFSPDGKLLASSGEDKTVRLWELRR